MVPWYLLFLIPIALVVGWVTPGVWRRLKERAKKPVYTALGDIKTHLTTIYEGAETDVTKVKTELAKVLLKIEKALP
jgi:hypothetical protein